MAATSTQPTRCRRCGHPLRNTRSIAAGVGPTCARIIRAELADYTPEQTAKAVRVVHDGGVRRIPSTHYRLYQVQGTYTAYQSDGLDCTCAGAREHGGCYHAMAVRIHIQQRQAPAYRLAA